MSKGTTLAKHKTKRVVQIKDLSLYANELWDRITRDLAARNIQKRTVLKMVQDVRKSKKRIPLLVS